MRQQTSRVLCIESPPEEFTTSIYPRICLQGFKNGSFARFIHSLAYSVYLQDYAARCDETFTNDRNSLSLFSSCDSESPRNFY